MNEPPSFPTVTVKVKTVDADTVFAALGDPTRRRLLLALFDGQPRPGRALAAASGTRFDNARKHLDGLAKAGLIVADLDPADQRRQVYRLAPAVRTTQTPEGRTMDFGYCTVRL